MLGTAGKLAGNDAGKILGKDVGKLGATGTVIFIEELSSIFTVGSLLFVFLQPNKVPTQNTTANILKYFIVYPKKKGRPESRPFFKSYPNVTEQTVSEELAAVEVEEVESVQEPQNPLKEPSEAPKVLKERRVLSRVQWVPQCLEARVVVAEEAVGVVAEEEPKQVEV